MYCIVKLWTCPKSLSGMYIVIRTTALHILGIRMWKNWRKISNSLLQNNRHRN